MGTLILREVLIKLLKDESDEGLRQHLETAERAQANSYHYDGGEDLELIVRREIDSRRDSQ